MLTTRWGVCWRDSIVVYCAIYFVCLLESDICKWKMSGWNWLPCNQHIVTKADWMGWVTRVPGKERRPRWHIRACGCQTILTCCEASWRYGIYSAQFSICYFYRDCGRRRNSGVGKSLNFPLKEWLWSIQHNHSDYVENKQSTLGTFPVRFSLIEILLYPVHWLQRKVLTVLLASYKYIIISIFNIIIEGKCFLHTLEE